MWTEELKDAAKAFEGTCASLGEISDALAVSDDQVEDLLLDAGLERCSDCEWWCEVGELIGEDGMPSPCPSCCE
ncbi:hypothetical protein V5F40_22840 [Xanthobacter sp. DSM 14520]|uniref:hypothetical protein n=1 Tax=Xanthobacter autotrophicus (strain ATCC BAA-1158 / Py2) TaxID=78245 RepID=UPI00372A117A